MLATAVTIISIGFLVELALAHRSAAQALRRRDSSRPGAPETYPPVSIVRPVKGVDVEQAENFRAALDTGYPGETETIFVLEDEEDPAWPNVRRAVEEHRRAGGHGTARVVLAGPPPGGRTGKINNMIHGAAEARHRFIAFGDSDTRPDQSVLANLIAHLVADGQAGAGFAPPVTRSRPLTAGDVGHAIVLNAFLVANLEKALGRRRELPFLMGQLMVFRAAALQAIGGVKCADGQLVDDMYLGARVAASGYRNVMGTHAVQVVSHGLAFGEFLRLWRRWLFCGRGGIPASFVRRFAVRATSFYLALGLSLLLLVDGPGWAAVGPALLLGLEGAHHVRLHRLCGGAPVPARLLWMAWVPYLTAIPIGVSMLVRPQLEWRGHTYHLDTRAMLRPAQRGGTHGPAAADGTKDERG